MSFDSARDIINSAGSHAWQTDKSPDGTQILWLPVLVLPFGPERTIGFNDKGFWTIRFANGKIEIIDTRDKCYYLIICLQKDRNEFENILQDSLRKHGLGYQAVDTFPWKELLKMTLQTETHWAGSAAFWVLEKDMDNELAAILTAFIDNKRFPQSARHHVFRVLTRWQKNR